MNKKMTVWFIMSGLIALCSFVLLITIGCLSSELGWLYFSGKDMTPSNYVLYYIEQILGVLTLASVVSIVIWIVVAGIKILKKELA